MTTTSFTPALRRIAWKEYRTLRGLWLAVAALAVIVQAISAFFAAPGTDLPALLFGTALAATALHAVGAAAILFAVEHEDETYDFLTGLPTTWAPVFAGKLLVATLSSIALALTLLVTGWIIAGHWPSPFVGGQLGALFGLAIFEALAWGTLFSLLLRQPLLVALLTIFAASASVTFLIGLFVGGTNSTFYLSSYAAVVPYRILLLGIIALADVLIAQRWLPAVRCKLSPSAARLAGAVARVADSERSLPAASVIRSEIAGYSRANVVARLLWQSWRQSSTSMAFMLAIVAFVVCVALLFLGLGEAHRSVRGLLPLSPFGVTLIGTALFASTTFYADQRRDQYRFLAEHAARPRYVWLCRLLTYIVPILLLLLIVVAVLSLYSSVSLRQFAEQMSWCIESGRWHGLSMFSLTWTELMANASGAALSLWGIALGFAIGQFCSLIVRRALMAGFAAVLCSVVALAWGATVWAWELPPIIVLFPLVVAPFAATWLRAPDWIADRNHLHGWAKVFAALALPAALVAMFVPVARSISADPSLTKRLIESSVPFDNPKLSHDTDAVLVHTVAKWVDGYDQSPSPQARANADWILRLSDLVNDPPRPTHDETWEGDRSDEDWTKWREKRLELNHELITQAVDLSDKELSFPPWQTISRGSNDRDFAHEHVNHLIELISSAGADETAKSNFDLALKNYLAALRLLDATQRGQSTQNSWTPWIAYGLDSGLVQWASAKGQTAERVKEAIRQIEQIYPDDAYATTASPALTGAGRPHPALLADYLQLRDVMNGRRTPSGFEGNPNYLAYLANMLPFERERALRVLDFLLVDQTDRWLKVRRALNQKSLLRHQPDSTTDPPEKSAADIAAELRAQIGNSFSDSYNGYEFSLINPEPPYAWLRTTYLLRDEIGRLQPFYVFLERAVDAEVSHWGLKQQLALVAYRLDHGEYPEKLDAIAPEYLPFVPIDPYSGRQFEYRPAGLDRELEVNYSPGIAPHTPVLWSVGPQNAQLEATTVDRANPNAETNPSAPVSRQEVYRLNNPNGFPYIDSELVFPLPK